MAAAAELFAAALSLSQPVTAADTTHHSPLGPAHGAIFHLLVTQKQQPLVVNQQWDLSGSLLCTCSNCDTNSVIGLCTACSQCFFICQARCVDISIHAFSGMGLSHDIR